MVTNAGEAWSALHALLDLTERAIDTDLRLALQDTVAALATPLGADLVAVHLERDGRLEPVAAAGPGASALAVLTLDQAAPGWGTAKEGPDRAVVAIRPSAGAAAGLVTIEGYPAAQDLALAMATAVASAQRAVLARATDTEDVERLRAQASVDDLTGALNRRAFFERFDGELSRQRNRQADWPVTLVLFDLDHFKAINDRHGHPAGDTVLVAFTRVLERNVRASDTVGRVGGDEFALLLVGAGEEDAQRVLDRLLDTLRDGVPGVADVQASHGVARCPHDGDTRDTLFAEADRRLYEDKRRRGALSG